MMISTGRVMPGECVCILPICCHGKGLVNLCWGIMSRGNIYNRLLMVIGVSLLILSVSENESLDEQ